MNKKLKKLCTVALTLAITASSAISMSVSAWDIKISHLSDYTIVEDKGMMAGYTYKENKVIYDDQYDELIIADSNPRIAQFFLSEDVDYEEVNERIIEIFKEFYPDNYLDVSPDGVDYREYTNNYKPNLWANTINDITIYTLCAIDRQWPSIEDEKIAEVKKYSKAFMEKLNEEKLISEFYDFGEVYYPSAICSGHFRIAYFSDVDIDLIQNYIDEHNIDCTIKKNYYRPETDYYDYILEFNDGTTRLEQFLTAVDIYEATSIETEYLEIPEIGRDEILYGHNSLEDLTTNIIGDANEDETTDIRDAAFIAKKVAQRKVEELPEWADYNNDETCDIRDAAAIAKDVAKRIL